MSTLNLGPNPLTTIPPSTAQETVTMTPDELAKLIQKEVAAALAAQPKGLSWAAIRGNKYFVLATSSLAGALGEQIFEAVKNHTLSWNKQSLGAMLSTAAGSAVVAVYHLYLQPSTVPPDKTQAT